MGMVKRTKEIKIKLTDDEQQRLFQRSYPYQNQVLANYCTEAEPARRGLEQRGQSLIQTVVAKEGSWREENNREMTL